MCRYRKREKRQRSPKSCRCMIEQSSSNERIWSKRTHETELDIVQRKRKRFGGQKVFLLGGRLLSVEGNGFKGKERNIGVVGGGEAHRMTAAPGKPWWRRLQSTPHGRGKRVG